MPWCATCDRFLSPSTVRADGTCPACARAVDPGRARPREAAVPGEPARRVPAGATTDPATDPAPVPWHFKLFLAAFALYLGWRAWDLVQLLV